MKKKSWGPREAASHLHVSVRTVQRWLSGHRKVPPMLERIIHEEKPS